MAVAAVLLLFWLINLLPLLLSPLMRGALNDLLSWLLRFSVMFACVACFGNAHIGQIIDFHVISRNVDFQGRLIPDMHGLARVTGWEPNNLGDLGHIF